MQLDVREVVRWTVRVVQTDSHKHDARFVHYSVKIGWCVVTCVLKVFAVRVLYASSGWSLDSDVSGHPSHPSKDKKHAKVQSMTEPLTKLTCRRLSHNQRWRPYLNVISGWKILSGKPDVTSWLTRWRTNVQTGYPTECVRRLHVKNVNLRGLLDSDRPCTVALHLSARWLFGSAWPFG